MIELEIEGESDTQADASEATEEPRPSKVPADVIVVEVRPRPNKSGQGDQCTSRLQTEKPINAAPGMGRRQLLPSTTNRPGTRRRHVGQYHKPLAGVAR